MHAQLDHVLRTGYGRPGGGKCMLVRKCHHQGAIYSWDGRLRSIEKLGNRPSVGVGLYEARLQESEGHTPWARQGRLSRHPNVIDRASEFHVYRIHHLRLQVRATTECAKL